jgi:hypothetical protein
LLILSGTYIGHLPTHYARSWEIAGAMRSLLPRTTSYVDSFHLAHARGEQNRAAGLLRRCVLDICRTPGGQDRISDGGSHASNMPPI